MRGFYLGLEGGEGAGKSTVAGLLTARFEGRGRSVVRVREPGGTGLGEEIRRLLLHTDDMSPWAEVALFAAGRAQLVEEVVRDALGSGAIVISDRTYFSSVAYQGHARGLGLETVRVLNETVLAGTVPDLVVVIDLDPETGIIRQTTADRIGAEGIEFQRKVREGYLLIAADRPGSIIVVAGSQTPEAITTAIETEVLSRW